MLKFNRVFPCLAILILLNIFNPKNLHSQDTSHIYRAILFVGNLNDDNVQDTVVSETRNFQTYIPAYILWGHDTSSNGIPSYLKLTSTDFVYPSWLKLRGSCFINFVNNDTLSDITLIVWGKRQIDSTTFKDTTAAFTIFGKRGFDTIAHINLTQIDSFQTSPIVAMKLKMGKDFTDGAIRDMSKIPSYVYHKTNFPSSQLPHRQANLDTLVSEDGLIKVYPNPTSNLINIKLTNLPAGLYTLKLVNLNGDVIKTLSFTEQSNTDQIKQMYFTENSSGYYILLVLSDNKVMHSFPIIKIN